MNFATVYQSRGLARVGRITLRGGLSFETPAFLPVATQAIVKSLDSSDMSVCGASMLLANTYHLVLRPGLDVIRESGRLHTFMNWSGGILTDSGGFQIMSLSRFVRLQEEGALFQSHIDGTRHQFTPENVIDAQLVLGSDAITCLDVCRGYPLSAGEAREALELTKRWAQRSRQRYQAQAAQQDFEPLLFGIIQGGFDLALRREAAQHLADHGFKAFAYGGLSVGEPKELTWAIAEAIGPLLPQAAPRYLMGVGDPLDFWEACGRGIDLMDCVLPTRNARNGQALTSVGKLYVKNKAMRRDFSPLDPNCNCLTCVRYTRAYLCHLFHAGELSLHRLLSLHNIVFMIRLSKIIREAIAEDRFNEAFVEFKNAYLGSVGHALY